MSGCQCHASLGLVATDLQSMLTPLMDSLHSELQLMILIQLDQVVRPLKEEASIIKLWLARVATHLEHVEMPSKEPLLVMWSASLAPVFWFSDRTHQFLLLLQQLVRPPILWFVRVRVCGCSGLYCRGDDHNNISRGDSPKGIDGRDIVHSCLRC
jgi:hypothetical protein